jgi:propanediol utilization protein
VEILASDNYKLGTKAPVRESGDLEGSAEIEII